MAKKAFKAAVSTGIRSFVVTLVIAGAVAMSGLPEHVFAALAPKPDTPVPLAAAHPRPAPKPAAPTPMAAQQPAAAPAEAAPAQAAEPAQPAYVIKSAMTIDKPLRHGDWYWNDEGVPEGEMLVTVDLKAQTLSVFRAGYEIGVAVILYGANDKPSPLGTFPITQKKRDHISNLYDAPMPYMLRLTNDGVAIHGSDVKWGYATHGCIGVPTAFAAKLFDQVKLGDRVVVTNGKMLSVGATA